MVSKNPSVFGQKTNIFSNHLPDISMSAMISVQITIYLYSGTGAFNLPMYFHSDYLCALQQGLILWI
jgi:hypothetical protein